MLGRVVSAGRRPSKAVVCSTFDPSVAISAARTLHLSGVFILSSRVGAVVVVRTLLPSSKPVHSPCLSADSLHVPQPLRCVGCGTARYTQNSTEVSDEGRLTIAMAEIAMTKMPLDANGLAANGQLAVADAPAPSVVAPAAPPALAFSLRRNIKQLPPISATLCVALGGALGALLRYGFIQACAPYQTSSTTSGTADGTVVVTLHKPFPLSTFVSNILGCLLIGLLSILLPALLPSSHSLLLWRSLLVTGLLGALTTMSSFVLDSAELWQHQRSRLQGEIGVVVIQAGEGREWVGVLYWLLTNVGGIALVVIGRRAARWVERRYVRKAKREADVNGVIQDRKQAGDAERAVVREAAADHKEQAMVEVGEGIDLEKNQL